MKATIKDVVKLAGVSFKTTSRVIYRGASIIAFFKVALSYHNVTQDPQLVMPDCGFLPKLLARDSTGTVPS
jgi:hypothetical protein